MSWKDPRSLRDIAYVLVSLVPPGYTVTYGVLAQLLGTSPRAVGAFMRANREPVVVPCHRVVGSRGLGGYSLGLGFKAKLLRLEGALDGNRLRVVRSVDEFWELVEEHGYPVPVDP